MSENDQKEEVSMEQLQADLDNAMNNWKRTAADFENFKKQKERENKELIEFAREVTVAKLLPTLDTLSQALRHIPAYSEHSDVNSENSDRGLFVKQYENWQTGIQGILMQLNKTLEEFGVKKIQAVGKKFDPHLHEAVKEAESDQEDGMIVGELQTGYELNGKVIRPSQVIISKKATTGGE
jgi:molecular chaperone GrpE